MNGGELITRNVLVLNRLWQPVHICNVRRAVSLLFRGAALTVQRTNGEFCTHDFRSWVNLGGANGSGERCIRTVSLKIVVPEIIQLLHYDRIPAKEVKLTRKNIYLRDGNICQYCGKSFREPELNLDHVVPRRLGGATTWTNLVCSCVECNLRKGEKTLSVSGMGLIRSPKKPRWSPFNRIAFRGGVYPSWDHFLKPEGWKVQISGGLS